MPAILRMLSSVSKGVVAFTTRDEITLLKALGGADHYQHRIKCLRESGWSVLKHFNWHDHNYRCEFKYDGLMAGRHDIILNDGKSGTTLDLDCCNFAPKFFAPNRRIKYPKIYDFLFVGNAVYFKNIPNLLRALRQLIDNGFTELSACLIIPIPPFCYKDAIDETAYYYIYNEYRKLFSSDERSRIVLHEFRSGFPMDLSILENFYNISRIFVHPSNVERRCRVLSYAFAIAAKK